MNQQNPQTSLNQPSVKQLRCIIALCRENKLDETAYQPETKKQASEIIDELKGLPGSRLPFEAKQVDDTWSRTDRIQAFSLATRITVEKTRTQNVPLYLDDVFWAAVRSTYREYEKQLKKALLEQTGEAAA